MASALLKGVFDAGFIVPENVILFDLVPEKLCAFVETGCTRANDPAELVKRADIIILAVKPQVFETLFAQIGNAAFDENKLVISIAAGVSILRIKQLAGFERLRVVRAMPSAPSQLGRGAAVVAFEPPVTEDELDFAVDFFKCTGVTYVVDECDINKLIAVFSTAPAFFFEWGNIVEEYAASHDLDPGMALSLYAETLVGAAEMIKHSGKSCKELSAMVTSPKGTTLAALDEFARRGAKETVLAAMNACTRRAEELSGS